MIVDLTDQQYHDLADAFLVKAKRFKPRWRRSRWTDKEVRQVILQVIVDTELTVSGVVPIEEWSA